MTQMKNRNLVPVVMVIALSVRPSLTQELRRPADPNGAKALIEAINDALSTHDSGAFSGLVSPDADLWSGCERIGQGGNAIYDRLQDHGVWSEVTPPRLEIESSRMISSEVALVDARQVQYGSVIVKRALHITLVLRYEEAKWRIAAMRVAAPCINVVRPAATALTSARSA
jgi:hypothetical protein